MNGEEIKSNLNGLYIANEKQHIDTNTIIKHNKPNSYSKEIYKGILDDEARAVFSGKIIVEKDAQKSNAHQLNRNILLSSNATINSKPQLEIYADDVKCAHGSTTGQLSDEELFYFEARGIKKSKARQMLAKAFAFDVVLKIDNLHMRKIIEQKLIEKEMEIS